MMVVYAMVLFGVIATGVLVSASHHHRHGDHDYYAKPKYHFKYGVDDPKHGDHHSQWEERDGDKVKGGYSIKDADGTWRHVHYTADKENGFNAVVERHGKAAHPHHYHHSHEHQLDKIDLGSSAGYAVTERHGPVGVEAADSSAASGARSSPIMLEVGHEAMDRYPDAAYGYIE